MKETAQHGADAAALAGAFAGIPYAGVGFADAASHSASASQLAPVALLYAAVGIVASAAMLGCIRAIRGLRRKPLRSGYECIMAALWASVGLLTGYGVVWLNLYVLLDYPWFSPVAIGTTLVFCASTVLAGWTEYPGRIARTIRCSPRRVAGHRPAAGSGRASPGASGSHQRTGSFLALANDPTLEVRGRRHRWVGPAT